MRNYTDINLKNKAFWIKKIPFGIDKEGKILYNTSYYIKSFVLGIENVAI